MHKRKLTTPLSIESLPAIPGKRYFTIGEASDLCELKPSVLRYWESEFEQLVPVKRRGNRRYYSQKDILTIRTIKELLHEKGYTIQGAKLQLCTQIADAAPVRRTQAVDKSTLIAELKAIFLELS